MKLLRLLFHIGAAALGLLLGFFVPTSWQLPIFFCALALTAVSAAAAHTHYDPKAQSRAGAVVLLLVTWLVAGPAGELNRGRGPLYFTLALLFMCAYVGGLALAYRAT